MLPPPDWRVGDELTSARLQAGEDYARSGRLALGPGGGISGTEGADGTHATVDRRPEGWFRVSAAASPAGWYTLVSQVDLANGGWTDGTRTVKAREANLNSTVLSSAPAGAVVIVRAWRGRSRWNFIYAKCGS